MIMQWGGWQVELTPSESDPNLLIGQLAGSWELRLLPGPPQCMASAHHAGFWMPTLRACGSTSQEALDSLRKQFQDVWQGFHAVACGADCEGGYGYIGDNPVNRGKAGGCAQIPGHSGRHQDSQGTHWPNSCCCRHMNNDGTFIETLDMGPNETLVRGVFAQEDGTFMGLTFTHSKTFKTLRGATRWYAKRTGK